MEFTCEDVPVAGTLGSSADQLSRRQFLARTAVFGGAALAAGPLGAYGRAAGPSADLRVVVVGAGLAGLSCAYRLQQAGVTADVYEARADRVGGRCWTAREFAHGQLAEAGDYAFEPVFSPDGERIAFVGAGQQALPHIWTMRADGTHARQLTHGHVVDLQPDWGAATRTRP